jgi:hypothetical protein
LAVTILGTFSIDEDGREADRFQIKIVLDTNYPKSLPKVW